jgi:hypothetical protein
MVPEAKGGADYVKLQWIKAWGETGGKVPTYVSGSGNGFLLNINPTQ